MKKQMNPFNPVDWMALGFLQQTLLMSAGETIIRRSAMMGNGAMGPVEMTAMLLEKPTAFAKGMEKAAMAASRGKPMAQVATEFLKPMTKKAESNAKRLRR